MHSNTLLFSLLALTCFNVPIHTANTQESCGTSPRSHRGSIRHIESKGVGYTQGYTSVDLFVASNRATSALVPFVDTRFHIFNNGQPALNAGLGLRYLTSSWVYGMNSYYDYRKTHHFHYNQFSLGFEALGKRWDARVNGYLPVGKKKSDLYHTKFAYFKEHYAFLSSRQEFAMRGLNVEAGCHLKKMKHASFYAATGPYYFYNEGKNAIGGAVRVSATLYDHLKLEANGSYDPVFKGIGQGQISILFPFGPKTSIKKEGTASCSNSLIVRERALQPVDRNEIIVLDRTRKITQAINPYTGLPYIFFFVNNTSSSHGTFESPFPTLGQAQNASNTHDIIYVFEGNGTSYNAGSGFYLKDNQKFWGSGTTQYLNTTLGMVPIANQTGGLPLITGGVTTLGILNLANNNEISGVHLRGIAGTTGYGILGGDGVNASPSTTSVANAFIQNNTLDGAYLQSGIRLVGKDSALFALNTLNVTVAQAGGRYSGLEIFAIHSDYLKSAIVNENTIVATTTGNRNVIAVLINSNGIGSVIDSTIIGTNTFDATAVNGFANGILLSASGANAVLTSTLVGGNTINSRTTGNGDATGLALLSSGANSVLDSTLVGNHLINSFIQGEGASSAIDLESSGSASSIVSLIAGENRATSFSSGNVDEGEGYSFGIQARATGTNSTLDSTLSGGNQFTATSTGSGTSYATAFYSSGTQSDITTTILGNNYISALNTFSSGNSVGVDVGSGEFGSAVEQSTLTAYISTGNRITSTSTGTGTAQGMRAQSSGQSVLAFTLFGPNHIQSTGRTGLGINLLSHDTSALNVSIADGIFTVEGRAGGTTTGILTTQTGGTISGLIENNSGTVSGATTNTPINTTSSPNVTVRNNTIIAE